MHISDLREPSISLLILANCVPLIGVLFMGWSLFSVLFFYWLESLVVGFFNVLKMVYARGGLAADLKGIQMSPDISGIMATASKFFLIPFFIVHYGGFMMGHLVFIVMIPTFGQTVADPLANIVPRLSGFVLQMVLPALALFVSHGYSFYHNYIQGREFEKANVTQLMFAPYGRIVVMHLTLIFGAMLIMLTGLPAAAATLFIVLKVVVDIRAHQRAHARYTVINVKDK